MAIRACGAPTAGTMCEPGSGAGSLAPSATISGSAPQGRRRSAVVRRALANKVASPVRSAGAWSGRRTASARSRPRRASLSIRATANPANSPSRHAGAGPTPAASVADASGITPSAPPRLAERVAHDARRIHRQAATTPARHARERACPAPRRDRARHERPTAIAIASHFAPPTAPRLPPAVERHRAPASRRTRQQRRERRRTPRERASERVPASRREPALERREGGRPVGAGGVHARGNLLKDAGPPARLLLPARARMAPSRRDSRTGSCGPRRTGAAKNHVFPTLVTAPCTARGSHGLLSRARGAPARGARAANCSRATTQLSRRSRGGARDRAALRSCR